MKARSPAGALSGTISLVPAFDLSRLPRRQEVTPARKPDLFSARIAAIDEYLLIETPYCPVEAVGGKVKAD